MSWDDGAYYDASCGIGRSRRYHSHMRDFYRRWADFVTVVTVVSGTSAFATIFLADKNALPAQILTGAITVVSVLNLVFSFSKKADLHERLTRDFTKLSADIELLKATPGNLAKVRARRLIVEADEPHVRRLIDLRAQNEEWRARGVSFDRLCPLGFWQERSWLAYYFDFALADIQKRLKERDA